MHSQGVNTSLAHCFLKKWILSKINYAVFIYCTSCVAATHAFSVIELVLVNLKMCYLYFVTNQLYCMQNNALKSISSVCANELRYKWLSVVWREHTTWFSLHKFANVTWMMLVKILIILYFNNTHFYNLCKTLFLPCSFKVWYPKLMHYEWSEINYVLFRSLYSAAMNILHLVLCYYSNPQISTLNMMISIFT